MKRLSLYSVLIFCLNAIFLCSCSKSAIDSLEPDFNESEMFDSTKYLTPDELKQLYTRDTNLWKFTPYNGFHDKAVWKEVVYDISNPNNYTIYRYKVEYVSGRFEKEHYLYENDKLIGYITEPDSLSNVYFTPIGDSPQLLYNFIDIERSSCGIYSEKNGLILYSDLRVPRDKEIIQVGYTYISAFSKDVDDNIVISCIGALSGILSPIMPAEKVGKRREVLLVYRIEFDAPKYINLESPVTKYLPDDFWEGEWASKKYKEYKDSQK